MIASRQELIVGSNVPMISQKQWESSCKSANGRNTGEPPTALIMGKCKTRLFEKLYLLDRVMW